MADPFDVLAPWDAAAWFQTTTQTLINTATVPTRIVRADPQRIGLIIASTVTNIVAVGVNPNAKTTPVVEGMPVSSSTPPLVILFRDVGPMVQMEWWATTSLGSVQLTVWEIRLKEWPRLNGGRVKNGRRSGTQESAVSSSGDRFNPAFGTESQ
jgi:hypothetical protein